MSIIRTLVSKLLSATVVAVFAVSLLLSIAPQVLAQTDSGAVTAYVGEDLTGTGVGDARAGPLIAQADENSSSNARLLAQTPDGPVIDPTTPAEDAEADPDTERLPGQEASCEGSFAGLGWVLCQGTRYVLDLFDYLTQVVLGEGLLEVNIINDEPALEVVWAGFKNIANIFFVIAFLVIIYAEASGRFGAMEAFSFTRLLPRLAFSVIGIQLSFFIVGYLIALFNDFGAGATQLVLSPIEGFSEFELAGLFDNATDGGSFYGIPTDGGGDALDGIIAALAITGLGLGFLVIFPGMIIFGIIGLTLLLLTLIARKIIIVALVIVAPIAFVAYVLPNTEKLFKSWWDLFIRTLAMYPIIMIFIASGQLLGRIVIAGDNTDFIDSVIGFTATFLPLFLIPLTFRLAGSAITALAGSLQNVSQKAKGDIRDPRSVRSQLRDRRGRNYQRYMSGEKKGIPTPVRRAIKRLPFVDSTAPLIADMSEGQKWQQDYGISGADDILRAIAVTGGGELKGRGISVLGEDGKTATGYTGYLKQGKRLARDESGNIIHSRNGIAMMSNTAGTEILGEAKSSDFYDKELMAEVRSMNMSRGRLTAAASYTMGKATDEYTQSQIWHGMHASRWNGSELQDYVNNVWYANKGTDLQHKFLDYDYFNEPKPGKHEDTPVRMMNAEPEKLASSFKSMVGYVDKRMGSYDFSKQSGAYWRYAESGLRAAHPKGFKPSEQDQVDGLYDKAVQGLAKRRFRERDGQPEVDPETGEIISSQATSEAIREMQQFISTYESYYGPRNGSSQVDFEQ